MKLIVLPDQDCGSRQHPNLAAILYRLNGAYYAPDLTKAWLDPGWIDEANREAQMLAFLKDPPKHARTYGSGRRMPQLDITDEEAHGVVAFLKWMSSIDTNGFPHNFKTLTAQE